MPAPTNSERIHDLAVVQASFRTTLEFFKANFVDEMSRANSELLRLLNLNETNIQKIAALEQRCLNFESQSTRHWQIWLAIIGAFLALAVNIFRK